MGKKRVWCFVNVVFTSIERHQQVKCELKYLLNLNLAKTKHLQSWEQQLIYAEENFIDIWTAVVN